MNERVALVITAHRQTALLASSLHYHRRIGVGRIDVFVDRPDAVLPPDDAVVHWHRRDDALAARWRRTRLYRLRGYADRPIRLMDRQELNAALAIEAATAAGFDWIVHLDADELLYAPEFFGPAPQTVGDALAPLAARGIETVTFLNHEALVEQVDVVDPAVEVTLFKRNPRTLPGGSLSADQRSLVREVPQLPETFFSNYANGKAAARVSADLLTDSVHDFKLPREQTIAARLLARALRRNRPARALGRRFAWVRRLQATARPARRRHALVSANPSVLHYPHCGFAAFWEKFTTLDPADNTGLLRLNAFQREALRAAQTGDVDHGRAFYRERVTVDPATADRLIDAGLALRITEPAAWLAAHREETYVQ